ncbi:MAG: hypothetical protein R6U78_04765 [Bacteroidales bacterium]
MKDKSSQLSLAADLIRRYIRRTGITGEEGDPDRRYLWTDAFAVQSLFALANITGSEEYNTHALELMNAVHWHLGRHREDDPRTGWISGLNEKEGAEHPTSGGLRIGKRLPERKPGEPVNERLEWERDGQYFHYLTRWVNALLTAQEETDNSRYSRLAAELLLAGRNFIVKTDGGLHMYWKMSIDLSHPLVPTMGAHDPLEGLICSLEVSRNLPGSLDGLEELRKDFIKLCSGRDWFTPDPLGIGGLLLDTVRTALMLKAGTEIPGSVHPGRLFRSALEGLRAYSDRNYDPHEPAGGRLAFRECGMTLGYHVISGLRDHIIDLGLPLNELDPYGPMVSGIEDYWMKPENHQQSSWTDHLDINSITLASSLVAEEYPYAFTGIQP